MTMIPAWKDVQIRRFECPKGLSIKTFAMRELTVGDDKDIDANVALFWPANGEKKDTNMKAYLYESIRKSLVEVDGKPLDTAVPYLAMDEWTQRTMNFVLKAYSKLNGSDDKDDDSFLEKSESVALDRLGM